MSNLSYDKHQFDGSHPKRNYPVRAWTEGGELKTTQLDFADYSRMHVQKRNGALERRLPAPAWANDDVLTREIVLRVCEERLYIVRPKSATDAQRLAVIRAKSAERKPQLEALITRLCKRYVPLSKEQPNARETKMVAMQIKNVDSQLMSSDKLPELITMILYHYLRRHQDSVAVSQLTKGVFSPVGVRKLISRVSRIQLTDPKCRLCGKEFSRKQACQIYCSRECQDKVNKPRRVQREHTCRECGCTYLTSFSQQRYCTARCRIKVQTRKNSERRQLQRALRGLCAPCRKKQRDEFQFAAQFNTQ